MLLRFSNNAFNYFQQENEDLINKGKVIRNIVPVIASNPSILTKQDLLFTRFKLITSKMTVNAKLDLYNRAPLIDIDKRVQNDISDYIIPTKHLTAPMLLNFFLEAKALKGRADVTKRQACYNSALGARAMH